jgi:hypothetical protein
MKIGPVSITLERSKPTKNGDESWKKLRDTVDKIFELTSDDRKSMQNNLDFYNGKIWATGELRQDDSKAYHNLVFSTIQSIAPTLSDNRPIWGVISRYPFMQRLANSYDAALQYGWDKLEMADTVHDVVLDAMIQKIGIFFVDFDYAAEQGGEICIEAQDPKEFFIAPGYTDPWKAPFCGVKKRVPLSMLRKMFGKEVEIKPDNDEDSQSMQNRSIGYGTADDFELETYFATLYVVWMRDDTTEVEIEEDVAPEDEDEKPKKKKVKAYPNGKFRYFTVSTDLGTRASEYSHGKPPWVIYYNYKKPHDFLGTSEVDHIKELVKEYNLQFQKLTGYVRKYHDRNFTADANRIDVDLVKSTFHKGGNVYAVDETTDHTPVIKPVEYGQFIPDAYNIMGMIPKMIEEDSGATDVSKGIASKKQRQSASEIAVLVESSYTRTRQRVRNLEKSLKRVCWLLVSLMQQNYSEMRTFHVKKEEDVVTDKISNSNAFAQSMVASPDSINKGMANEAMQGMAPQSGEQQVLSESESQEYEDYKKFIEIYGDQDPVYFDFDIVIETNSSLPLDKQSRANLAMSLWQSKGIDRKALLETIRFPKGEEIAARMDAIEQAAANPQPMAQPGLGPETPLDISGKMQTMEQGVPG